MTDSCAFRKAVSDAGLKYKSIAKRLAITTYGLQRKIDNLSEFKASEIAILSELLTLSKNELSEIFFAEKSD